MEASLVEVLLLRAVLARGLDVGGEGAGRQDLDERSLDPRTSLVDHGPGNRGPGREHDAGILASAGVDSAMLFVRSLNGGVSHSPDELSSREDVELATEVLTGALRRLVSSR